jgi:uncharacterized membrane protein YkgB
MDESMPPSRTVHRARNRRVLVSAVGALVVAVLMGVVVGLWTQNLGLASAGAAMLGVILPAGATALARGRHRS